MVEVTKDFVPKDMDDLEVIFYGENKDGVDVDAERLRRYLDYVRTEGSVASSSVDA